ncbi:MULTISPECIES: 2-phosphosulfolactate phosphatase [Parachlamydia]|jgi:2-phosphosulfolactate phosphatase|uniref:Probable 2-phosphosulfolactate phosphatase n=2 Tax=Parachlamydia acanthamoebae TaxID=83552 RepID=F8KYI2_PARAV|nr:2-phosphosulfolactate phosphatase [Parachlamydia acanthamoebae]EFB42348.1 hypothetical protein pah_c010o046 [Parachlamydia acanthamoebae str. Hall's coccus]KIA78337.1 putative 2-phosphosulfolactate phosphatase [Parachlamydia acanthamoebae]CCB85932.1 putative 2-phosphosulfolactate phosphatase [Parachlamydia acanthamoebae UV-7]
MNIKTFRMNECIHAEGLVVVIDVIRAFTTAAFAFASGVEKIFVTRTVDEALSLHAKFPHTRTMGEVDGFAIQQFNYGNSPLQFKDENLTGITLIQRTSSGTQGIINCIHAQQILAASFVVAEATLKYIRFLQPAQLSLVVTGPDNADEDLAFADYLSARLNHHNVSPRSYLERVKNSPSGKKALLDPLNGRCSFEDLQAVLQVNRFPFFMEVLKEKEHFVLKAFPEL